MLESIDHMTLRLHLNLISAIKTLSFCHFVRNVVMDVIMFTDKYVNHEWFINFIAWRISYADALTHDKQSIFVPKY